MGDHDSYSDKSFTNRTEHVELLNLEPLNGRPFLATCELLKTRRLWPR
jgi:hypothetical protein